jgi:hypothetical protein
VAEVLHRTFWRRRHVPSRGDDSNPRPREPRFDQLLREMVACGDQDVRSPQREPIERRLGLRANAAVVDAAGRLMEDGDHGNAVAPRREGRSCERGGDRVDEDGARSELLRTAKHRCAAEGPQWEGPLGKGEEDDARIMRGRCVRHTQVIQVPPAQPMGIA